MIGNTCGYNWDVYQNWNGIGPYPWPGATYGNLPSTIATPTTADLATLPHVELNTTLLTLADLTPNSLVFMATSTGAASPQPITLMTLFGILASKASVDALAASLAPIYVTNY
jgi:hypothetical protein